MTTKIQKLQNERFNVFKTQDHENGDFDITFELGGKKLYAHKCMLRLISTTFASMFSDRWNKGETVPIETYGYNDFYQFLHFLYFGECSLTDDNIFTMVDIAEFFQVAVFKDECDEYLTTIGCTLENVIQLLDVAIKYSLINLKESLVPFMKSNLWNLLNDEHFFDMPNDILLEILNMVLPVTVEAEEIFEKVYEWAENQATTKKESNPKLNLNETIKEILADFIPLFDFSQMNYHFALKFLVGKSLFSPGPELSRILMNSTVQCTKKVKVVITDANGKSMKGQFCEHSNIYAEIQKLKK